MSDLKGFRWLGLCGAIAATVLLLAPAAKGEIVANFGTLSTTQSGAMSCGTGVNSCTGSPVTGSYGGQLPGVGSTFTHQIVFDVAADAGTSALTSILDSADFDLPNLSVALYLVTGGSTVVGGTATHGAALATGVAQSIGPSTFYQILFGGLLAGQTYVIEIMGLGTGVQQADATYTQQVNISAVPLPPALFLLAAALAGLVGFARFGRKTANV